MRTQNSENPELSHIEFRQDHSSVDWQELKRLFIEAGLGGRKGDKLGRAFINSPIVCYAYDARRLVGVARAVTDGEYHAVIYDVAIHPDYQGRGLGRKVMGNVLERLPVWRVMLVASSDVQGFYTRLGFTPYPDVMARLDSDRLCEATQS